MAHTTPHLQLAAAVAARHLRAGEVIAYPTEAVWGLGADPDNVEACLQLLRIKRRPVEKGMILIAASMTQFEPLLAPLAAGQKQLLAKAWGQQSDHGAVTYLVPDVLDQVPVWVKGGHDSVALRVSRHPSVIALCQAFGGPLISTSANVAGRPPLRSRLLLEKTLGPVLDYIMPGPLGGADKPSRIIDLMTSNTIRS